MQRGFTNFLYSTRKTSAPLYFASLSRPLTFLDNLLASLAEEFSEGVFVLKFGTGYYDFLGEKMECTDCFGGRIFVVFDFVMMARSTGMHNSILPVFIAKISAQEESAIEFSEAIAGVVSFTKEELKKGLVKGFLEVNIKGTQKQVPLRDAFLTFALLQAECRHLL